MWSNSNFGSIGVPDHDGADNNHQSSTNQMNFQENYQESEINQGGENFVNFSPITTGFPVYPMFPFEYYQSPDSNYIGSYMPNMYQPMPGFGNNEFLQSAFTNRINPENSQVTGSVAPAHLSGSTQFVPPISTIAPAQTSTPTQPLTLAKPATSMTLNTRAEKLKAQLIKSKAERAKVKITPKTDTDGINTLDPTSQEMSSLLRGSPTKPRNQSKGPMTGSMAFSTTPENIVNGIDVANSRPKPTQTENSASGIATEPGAHRDLVTKPTATGRAAVEDKFKGHQGASGLATSSIRPLSNTVGVVPNNAQSKGSQTKLNPVHSKSTTPQAKAIQDIEQKRAISKESPRIIQTKEAVPDVVGKERLPSGPSVVEKQDLIKLHSSTTMRDNKPVPRHEYPGRCGSNANMIGKPRIDICGKDNSNAKNIANIIHSPKEDKHKLLKKVLLCDNDLRDWLRLTKWDDLAHRKRALERHRAITAIDTEKARLLESVAKIEVLNKEKAKLVAQITDDEKGFGDKSPGGPVAISTTMDNGGSDADSVDHFDQAAKPIIESATFRKRSFSSFTSVNRVPLQPNSRRSRAVDARKSSPGNSRKEPFHQRQQDRRHSREGRGRSRDRRNYPNPRDMSPSLKAFLEREDAREAREAETRRHNAEFHGSKREDYGRYRKHRGQYHDQHRGRGRGYFNERR